MNVRGEPPVVAAAKKRTKLVSKSIDKAMKLILAEISENEGIYPNNGGRLSLAEVCRRAGVHPITLMGRAHRESTRVKVLEWIKGVGRVQGAKNVHATVSRRADAARENYRQVASQFQSMYQVEIPRRDDEIARLRDQVASLEAENLRLREELSQSRVVRLPVGKSRSKK